MLRHRRCTWTLGLPEHVAVLPGSPRPDSTQEQDVKELRDHAVPRPVRTSSDLLMPLTRKMSETFLPIFSAKNEMSRISGTYCSDYILTPLLPSVIVSPTAAVDSFDNFVRLHRADLRVLDVFIGMFQRYSPKAARGFSPGLLLAVSPED